MTRHLMSSVAPRLQRAVLCHTSLPLWCSRLKLSPPPACLHAPAAATKLCHIKYEDGTSADIMKLPKSDLSKYSLPGAMAVKRVDGVPTAFPADGGHVAPEENMLKVCWDKGPVKVSTGLQALCCIYAQRAVIGRCVSRMILEVLCDRAQVKATRLQR